VIGEHEASVKALLVLPETNKFVSCSLETIKLWNLNLRSIVCAENKAHFKKITSLVLLASSAHFASSSLDKTVKIWDFNLKPIKTIDQFFSGIRSLLLLTNGILAAGCLGDVILFSTTENHDQQRKYLKAHTKRVTSLAIAPNGNFCSASESDVFLWHK